MKKVCVDDLTDGLGIIASNSNPLTLAVKLLPDYLLSGSSCVFQPKNNSLFYYEWPELMTSSCTFSAYVCLLLEYAISST